MKFLCGNCKAKYQIADEKASGRTLRMKCRKCGHDILIDGHTMPASAPPPPATGRVGGRTGASAVSVMPGAARGGSGVAPLPPRPPPPTGAGRPATASRSKPPVSLSQDFRRHIAAPPEVPQRTAPYDLWHVAIQDVPVGPMTRDELGRKIDAGAVTSDSLCWREGMDDWRPLGELPELAQLLRRPRGDLRSQRPPARGRTAPPVVPVPPRASMFPGGEFEEIDDEGSEPTRIADMTGGVPALSPAAASAQPRSVPMPVPQMAGSPTSLPGEGSVAVPIPRREFRMSGSTGLALGLLMGILAVAGPGLYRTFWAAKQQQPTAQAAALPTPATPVEEKGKTIDLEETDVSGQVNESKRPRGKGTKTTTPAPPPKNDGLTDEQRKLLARMGGGSDPDIKGGLDDTPRSSSGPTLTASQLTSVVQNNKVQLQRCYESALRAAGGKQDGAIKITVAVTVGESGLVKSVATKGTGLGSMTECMKSSVKRWRFPSSQGESEFEFPLVFQPGA